MTARRLLAAGLLMSLPSWFPVHAVAQDVPRRDVSGEPARKSPDWLAAAVVYEVNVRTFSPAGDFAGVTARLDDLRALGVDVLWLMPIHPIGREKAKGSVGSPYAVRDYFAINPEYGTGEDLRRLVHEAHGRGMKVILDMVANHTAWDAVTMNQPDFYTKRDGRITAPVEDWADVADLDYSNPRLREYMIGVLEHWARQYDIDGYRCDVAMMVPTSFWEQARDRLDRTKPGLFMLAEAAEPELLAKAFDADYAWPFHSALNDVLTGARPASALREVWERDRSVYPKGALRLRFTDNHDERRAIARFGERGALAGAALVFTLDGIPLIYNGMEAGDTTESGAPALFERLPVFWGAAERRPEFPRFFQGFTALRHAHPALQQGEVIWLRTSGDDRVVAFLRRHGDDVFLVVINLSNRPWTGVVEADAGTWRDVTPPLAAVPAQAPPVGLPAIALDAWQFRVLRKAN